MILLTPNIPVDHTKGVIVIMQQPIEISNYFSISKQAFRFHILTIPQSLVNYITGAIINDHPRIIINIIMKLSHKSGWGEGVRGGRV